MDGLLKRFVNWSTFLCTSNCGEIYHLRLLLPKLYGATCFEDIRTIHGSLRPKFKSACMALGLLDDDGAWHAILNEASTCASNV